jgi:pimeloyl-ACP methyl ester carboxylesterase
MTMETVELSAGTIQYQDTGGDGPVVVLLHGLLMDASLWDAVIADLRVDHRCVAPTLPLGAHRYPMRADADHHQQPGRPAGGSAGVGRVRALQDHAERADRAVRQ